jgi:hypothetical protein
MQQQRYTAAAQFKHKIELYHSRSAASLHSVPAQLQVLQTAQTQVACSLFALTAASNYATCLQPVVCNALQQW